MMPGMKRPISLLLCATFLFTACGGDGGSTASADCQKEYWDGTAGICLPKGWVVIDEETLRQRGVPQDAIAAFQAQDPVSGQFPTVSITRELLTNIVEAGDYSDANIRSVGVLPNYALVDSTQVDIDGSTVRLHVFTAQPIADEPKRQFYQISTIQEKTGYTVTATTPVSVSDDLDTLILKMLQSATFAPREPAEGEEESDEKDSEKEAEE